MDLRQSLERVLSEKQVLFQAFYPRFLERCPELGPLFEGVNLPGQALMLTIAVQAGVEHQLRRYPAMAAYLKHLGARHEKLKVPRDSYPKFRDVLMETLAQFHGRDWSDDLAAQWRTTLEGLTDVMLEGYGTAASV